VMLPAMDANGTPSALQIAGGNHDDPALAPSGA
jgi:hypothetical protein